MNVFQELLWIFVPFLYGTHIYVVNIKIKIIRPFYKILFLEANAAD